MGWNKGYRIMEKQVVCLYDKGLLNKEVLDTMMEPFKGTDIDHGGSQDLRTNDGKSADDVICFIMEPFIQRNYTARMGFLVTYSENIAK